MSQSQLEAPTKGTSLWRNRDFLLLWSGQIISVTGGQVSQFALPLLVLTLTGSAAQAGFVSATHMLPYLLFSLPAGALIDRWNRKYVMLICDTIRWLLLASIPCAYAFGYLELPQLYFVAFIEGTANLLFNIARLSALPRVVAPGDVPRAYALSEITEQTASLVGPSLGGLIVQLARTTLIGSMLAYIVDSASYLVSVFSLCFMRVPFQQTHELAPHKSSLWRDITEGLLFLWRDHLLRLMALLTTLINFLQAGITLAVILLARETLHLDTLTLGFVISASGVGGLLGGVIAPWLTTRLSVGQVMIGAMLGWTLSALLLTLGNSATMLIGGMGLMGLLWPIYAVVVVSYRLSLVPDDFQGRLNSSFRLLTFGVEPLGSAFWGFLLVPLGARLELGLIAGGLALSALIACFTRIHRA
ncbi:MFS transporter [Ktedonospora formicarum]|uniref:MFS transporter n=1 Tax=Ktedonospora formicarum TaxID=2778364 RepID=A0A8J3I2P8_9CHLR|nr:MFS transporter [Ktedonospora formicarum]GHO44943.1 MFS transporter [Ktedonospora formicarum]